MRIKALLAALAVMLSTVGMPAVMAASVTNDAAEYEQASEIEVQFDEALSDGTATITVEAVDSDGNTTEIATRDVSNPASGDTETFNLDEYADAESYEVTVEDGSGNAVSHSATVAYDTVLTVDEDSVPSAVDVEFAANHSGTATVTVNAIDSNGSATEVTSTDVSDPVSGDVETIDVSENVDEVVEYEVIVEDADGNEVEHSAEIVYEESGGGGSAIGADGISQMHVLGGIALLFVIVILGSSGGGGRRR